MKTIIVACKTLEDEVNFALKKTAINYPIIWIESGLHNTPKKLNTRISEILNNVEADRILMVLGFCGNAVLGIAAKNSELIIPRVDDCISLLIGSAQARAQISSKYAAYFLTEGWIRGERNLWVEYQYAVDKYGEEEAASIAKMMYGHYRSLALLDTGVKTIEPLIESTKIIPATFKLEQKVIPATVTYLEQILTGPWQNEKFIMKCPGESITVEDLHF